MRRFGRVFGGLSTLVLLGLLLFALLNFRAIDDWWKLRGYSPPPPVAQLADRTTMTEDARRIFYVNHPQILANKAEFQQACVHVELTIVLGCYLSNQRGIVIFDVADERLNGVEEVTAAHEMLHAAYERLDSDTRQQINSWLMSYYNQGLDNQRIVKNIDGYRQSEPADVINEMHSIFATEITSLPAELENYYKRYFVNRGEVVKYSQQYEAAFTSREEAARVLRAQLDSLTRQIESLSAQLNAQRQSLEADRDNIQSQAEADAFNQRVRAYNSQVERYNSLINRYDDLREQYNQLVLQQRELIEAIDTRYERQPTQ